MLYDAEDTTRFEAVLSVFPDALLCGGYARDMLLGRTPKDMDFVSTNPPTGEQLLALELIADNALVECFQTYSSSESPYSCAAKFYMQGKEVNVLVRNDPVLLGNCPAALMRDFNYTINQAWYEAETGTYKWLRPELVEIKVAIWNSTCPIKNRLKKGVDKYLEYFPDWTFTLPK